MCAADEVAVNLFLAGRLKFSHIPLLVDSVLARHHKISQPSLEDIINADAEAHITAQELARQEKLHC
jgi:1-deoxy-D-xylulose-5-phosphate reductoisomerase